MGINFSHLLLCFLGLGVATPLFSQDTTKLRFERLENVKSCMKEVQVNSTKLIDWFKSNKQISPETYKGLEAKYEQLDKSTKGKTVLDSTYIRRLGNSYENLTQSIMLVYDSLMRTLKMPAMKTEIVDFYNSCFKVEDAINLYDDLNWSREDLLLGRYDKGNMIFI